jgi:hypothetical protein
LVFLVFLGFLGFLAVLNKASGLLLVMVAQTEPNSQ